MGAIAPVVGGVIGKLFGGGPPTGCGGVVGGTAAFRDIAANIRREIAKVRQRPARLNELLASSDWANQLNTMADAPRICPDMTQLGRDVLAEYQALRYGAADVGPLAPVPPPMPMGVGPTVATMFPTAGAGAGGINPLVLLAVLGAGAFLISKAAR